MGHARAGSSPAFGTIKNGRIFNILRNMDSPDFSLCAYFGLPFFST
ncbi:conserved hypothetical protein [delta proteobacterium NaphS2]|nr:conserved hypothetical protein [delta proteobacterium NaphS2]